MIGSSQVGYPAPVAGRSYAVYMSNQTYFTHANALGSSGMITDQTGAPLQEVVYSPWGSLWLSAGGYGNAVSFAGMKPWDPLGAETGNYLTPNRVYNPNWARWTSPDPLAGDITNPQSLNRYAYVLNNPTNLIDPLGLHWECTTTSFNGGRPHTTCTWVPDPAPVPEPVDPCALVSPGSYTGPPSCSIIYPTGDPGPTGAGNMGGGGGGTASATSATDAPNNQLPYCIDIFLNTSVAPFTAAASYVQKIPTGIKLVAAAAQNGGVTLTQLSNTAEALTYLGYTDEDFALKVVPFLGGAAAALHSGSGVLTAAGEAAAKYTPVLAVGALDVSLAYGLKTEIQALRNGECR